MANSKCHRKILVNISREILDQLFLLGNGLYEARGSCKRTGYHRSLLTVPQLKASVYDPSSPGIAVMANECSDFYERFDIMNVD